jgi:DNA modification methylase
MTQSAAALETVDWAFKSARTQDGPHGIHPYPAKFIPQIPRNLIRLQPPPEGTIVLDPFCGSGTTLVEAMLAGYPAAGVDLSPIACLIAKVKTTPLDERAMRTIRKVCSEAERRLARKQFEVPAIPRLDHWFQPQVQACLASLLASISQVDDTDTRDALRVALSSIVVRVSNQDSDTRYAAVEKAVSAEDVFSAFEQRAGDVVQATLSLCDGLHTRGPKPLIINQDVLTVRPEQLKQSVGLVVTSPPYPNAYEYWLYHKYRMYWLGMDPIAVREREIGARPHFFKGKNSHTAEHFLDQMTQVFQLLAAVMHPKGSACFLIGRSIIRGETIDNLALLRRAAEVHGFNLADTIERQIARTRKAFNLSHAAIESEHIAVFRRAR